MKNEYNSYFFNEFQKVNGGSNYMDEEKWVPFFAQVAQKIVDLFNPTRVLDAGCACGYLVAALRDLGVEAYGIDISKYAISKVREDVREYCFEHSITKPLPTPMPQCYDLVVVTEVLELLFPEDGEKAIANMCQYADTVVFSSTPSDIEDRTHVNVQQPEYWAELFYSKSFAKSFIFDMSMFSPWCVVYEKFSDMKKLIFNYELNMRIDKMENEKNLNKTIQDLMESLLQVTSKIYFDDAKGFCEENSLELTQTVTDGQLSIQVQIPENTISLRFDPVIDQYCLLKNVEIHLDNQQVSGFATNGEIVNHYIMFNCINPQIILDSVEGKKDLKITAKFQHLEEDVLQLFETKNATVNSTIEELSSQIEAAEGRLSEIKGGFGEKDELLLEKERVISEKNVQLNEKNTVIANRDKSLAEKEALMRQKDTALMEKTTQLSEKVSLLKEKEALIAEKEEILSKTDALVEEKVTGLKKKEAELLAKIESMEADIDKIAELEKSLDEKEAIIVRKEFDLTEKTKEVEENEALIAEKEQTVSQMDEELYQKNNKMADMGEQLKLLEEDCKQKTSELEQLSNDLQKVQFSYDSIQESAVWKIVAPFYKEPVADEEETEKGTKAKGKKETKDKKEKSKKDTKDTKDAKDKKAKGDKDKKDKKDKKEKEVKGKKDVKSKKGKKSSKKVEDEEGVELEEEFVDPNESILDDEDFVEEVPMKKQSASKVEKEKEVSEEEQETVKKPTPVKTVAKPSTVTKPSTVAKPTTVAKPSTVVKPVATVKSTTGTSVAKPVTKVAGKAQ